MGKEDFELTQEDFKKSKHTKKKRNIFKWLFWILFTLIIAAAVLAFIFKDKIFDAMGYTQKTDQPGIAKEETNSTSASSEAPTPHKLNVVVSAEFAKGSLLMGDFYLSEAGSVLFVRQVYKI